MQPPYVKVVDLKVNVDDRGLLTEVFRTDFFSGTDPAKQVYIVENTVTAIRAFHRHKRLVDYFIIIKGAAKFIFFPEIDKACHFQILNVSDRRLQMIVVPVGIFHGWKAEKGTILVSVANELYQGNLHSEAADEERIPWNTLGEKVWETQFK